LVEKADLYGPFGAKAVGEKGHPLPEHSQTKSPSALSRFLNINPWSTRVRFRIVRNSLLKQVLSECPKGRRLFLQVIIDLTTLEKCGKFKGFEQLISVYNGKRGLHARRTLFSRRQVADTLELSGLAR